MKNCMLAVMRKMHKATSTPYQLESFLTSWYVISLLSVITQSNNFLKITVYTLAVIQESLILFSLSFFSLANLFITVSKYLLTCDDNTLNVCKIKSCYVILQFLLEYEFNPTPSLCSITPQMF